VLPRITSDTKFCAVIGNPVGHSLSPLIHNAAFEAAGLNYIYGAFRVENVGDCLRGMRAMEGFRGLSVTIPHKVEAMAHMDALSPMAEQVGCINTVTNEDGRLLGSVTDGTGTLRAFKAAGVNLKDKKVVFIGAGGAVRAVAFAVAAEAGCGGVTILARDPKKAAALVADVSPHATCSVESGALQGALASVMASHDVVVQGTPVGMYPKHENVTPVPVSALRAEHIVFDMIYRPLETTLLQEATSLGCTIIHGTEMLVQQAAEQFETWTGVTAPVDVMRNTLLDALSAPA
jgi:shikimate dehydrogenase